MKIDLDRSYVPAWQMRWSEWFAWYPVITTDKKLVWLESVQRRKELVRYYGRSVPVLPNTFKWEWQYEVRS